MVGHSTSVIPKNMTFTPTRNGAHQKQSTIQTRNSFLCVTSNLQIYMLSARLSLKYVDILSYETPFDLDVSRKLHFWEDGLRDPELIRIDQVTRALDMHELAPSKSPKKALELEEVVRQCMNVKAKERPTASQVRCMLEKVFKVTVLLDNVKRCGTPWNYSCSLAYVSYRIASRAARALPFWHGRNMFAY
jgi:hypothetical protein